MLPTILEKIKAAAYGSEVLTEESLAGPSAYDRPTIAYIKKAGLKIGDEFYYRVSWNFDFSHYRPVAEFIRAYEGILEAEAMAEQAIEAEIGNQLYEATGSLYGWDENLYDEVGGPDAAIVVFPEYVEVRAYVSGVGNRIPKANRTYVGAKGDMRWHYPLETLSLLEDKGFPIAFAPTVPTGK